MKYRFFMKGKDIEGKSPSILIEGVSFRGIIQTLKGMTKLKNVKKMKKIKGDV